MNKREQMHGLTVLAALMLALPLPAKADIASQELLRQQERENALRQQQETSPDVRLVPAPVVTGDNSSAETPCFAIHQLQLNGEHAAQFQWLLATAWPDGARADGQCLGSRGINQLMTRMQNALVARGYVTSRVLASAQDLNSGVLALTLVPGRINSIGFSADSSPRARQWNALPAKTGDVLNLRDIEQALENFKRLPSADADIQITPSTAANARPGDSDVVIVWRQASPLRVNLSLDDGGGKGTGRHQGGLTVSYDHLLTQNDMFYLSLSQDLEGNPDKGTRGQTVHYQIPYGYWLLGLGASNNSYRQTVAGSSQRYVYSGHSNNQDIKLSRVLYRDHARKSTAYLRAWSRRSNNHVDDTEIEVQRARMAGWEAGVQHREFIGAATVDAGFAYRQATGAKLSQPLTHDGGERPALITANAQFSVPFQALNGQWRYSSQWRAQWNRTPLPVQDRFSLGGRYTVRGFDGESTLSAERGWLLRNELARDLGRSGHSIYLGLDYGEVGGASAHQLAGTRLGGGVLGLRGTVQRASYDIFVARPLKKPQHLRTPDTTAGFSLNWTL